MPLVIDEDSATARRAPSELSTAVRSLPTSGGRAPFEHHPGVCRELPEIASALKRRRLREKHLASGGLMDET